MSHRSLGSGLLVCLAWLTAHPGASAQHRELASFRLNELGNPVPVLLSETWRSARKSHFETSQPVTTDGRALFVLCALGEFAEKRGFSHIAVIQPDHRKFVLGLFKAETDAMDVVFGADMSREHMLGEKPGAVALLQPRCPKIPTAVE